MTQSALIYAHSLLIYILFLFSQENHQSPSHDSTFLNIKVVEHKLQVNYSFLAFMYGCGIVDQVIYHFQPEDLWNEIVELVRWRKNRPASVINCLKGDPVIDQSNQRHRIEEDSLSYLLLVVCLLY